MATSLPFNFKVEAVMFVAPNVAVPVTSILPNVAVDALTTPKVPVPFTALELASMLIASNVAEETVRFVVLRFVNTPLVFSTLLDVNPLTFVARLVISEMAWVCLEDAKPLVAAEISYDNPSTSDVEWVCPSRETLRSFTFNDLKVAEDAETVLAWIPPLT